jgi:hypothetical protein
VTEPFFSLKQTQMTPNRGELEFTSKIMKNHIKLL